MSLVVILTNRQYEDNFLYTGMRYIAAVGRTEYRPDIGVNIHSGGSTSAQSTLIANIMYQRGLKHARMDLIWDADQTLRRDMIQKINANGGKVEMSVQTACQFDHTVQGAASLTAAEAAAYSQCFLCVNNMKDLVNDFELLNEVQLRSEVNTATAAGGVVWNTAQDSVLPYQSSSAIASVVANLKGMYRAIRDIRASSGRPLRIIMGTVGRDWGFLTHLRNQGIEWDVTGYHIYPTELQASLLTDTWYGTGGPITKLGSFSKPIVINEFNAGEIYSPTYANSVGNAETEAGFRSFGIHMKELYATGIANIETITCYELLDEPDKSASSAVEARFGLMYNTNTPKVSMYLAQAFAGAGLSAAEQFEITSRGILTAKEIRALRR